MRDARVARLADIAAQAEVSEATVSRVLNGRPGVAEATREAVLTAVDVLGYDRPAKLRPKATMLVGLLLPELVNPVFPAFAQAIESALAGHGMTTVLCTLQPGGASEEEYVQLLLDRGVSGIIFVSGMHADSSCDPESYRRLRARGLPIVLVNGPVADVEVPAISTDDAASMHLAVGHLADLGHQRIGLAVGLHRLTPVVRKVEGFLDATRQRLGRAGDDLVGHTVFSVEGGAAAAGRLIGLGATAIICGSDLMALGAIRAARSVGLDVPTDLSVIGFDDSPLMEFTWPPLTTLRQRVEAMSEAAVRLLLDAMQGGEVMTDELLFPPELVVRGSTGAVRRR